jgi:hypothetical protein
MEPIMELAPKFSREAYIESMRQRVDEILGKVADAVNDASPGHIISASEEQVRDLFSKLRCEAYERAAQMRIDAAEAAFPPSAGCEDGKEQTQ